MTCVSYEQKVSNEIKIQNRATGVTTISQHYRLHLWFLA